MKTLVIAEKPDMGRSIAAALEPKAINHRTYIEGQQFIITWAIGHLIGLAEPDHYDRKYKKWSIHDLPIIPPSFQLLPNPKTKSQLQVIGKMAKQCDRIVNACDAGREGQLIFYYIQCYLKLTQPMQRLWISDLTRETIRSGFANLKPSSAYENLTKAAKARSEADWLIGMNGSRAFTTRHNVLLSVGRVQTPVLALIYDRQKEIEKFKSATYYEVVAHFKQGEQAYRGLWTGNKMEQRQQAEAIAAKVKGQPAAIVHYDIKQTKEHPPKLFDLTLLQREANAKFSFSAKKTLDLAQSLYEKHKAISYPRTNSNYVTEQNIPEMHRTFNVLKRSAYAELMEQADIKLVHVQNPLICKPEKVEDHHAILPTRKQPGRLTNEEQKVYELIVKRFLAHFYPPAQFKLHTVQTEASDEVFKTTVKEMLHPGWKQVYKDAEARKKSKQSDADEEQETDQPFKLDAHQRVQCLKSEVKEKQTAPPKAYTEGTLLKAMESAGKQIEDDDLREVMKDAGLGTPATRAATIERLKKVQYIEMKRKRIQITAKGQMAVEMIRQAGVQLLASPEMTGQWERRLHQISKGQAEDQHFMDKVKQFTALLVDKVKQQPRAAALPTASKKAAARKKTAASSNTNLRKVVAPCPREGCSGQIIIGHKGYGCNQYPKGCSFVIWQDSYGRSLSEATAKSIITKGVSPQLTFKNDQGNPFKARLRLSDPNTGKLEQIKKPQPE